MHFLSSVRFRHAVRKALRTVSEGGGGRGGSKVPTFSAGARVRDGIVTPLSPRKKRRHESNRPACVDNPYFVQGTRYIRIYFEVYVYERTVCSTKKRVASEPNPLVSTPTCLGTNYLEIVSGTFSSGISVKKR